MKWWDRERRIAHLRTLATQKGKESGFWFERWQKLGLELAAARAGRDNAREDVVARDAEIVALKRQVASTQLRLAESLQERERLSEEIAKYENGSIERNPS
jgi:hypothetical protein